MGIKLVRKKDWLTVKLLDQRLYWINPSKRGGMDGVFGDLVGLLQRIS